MKNTKRILGLVICMVLALGCLAGCKKESDETILTDAIKSINSAENFDVKANITGKMSLKMGEESQDMDLSTEVTCTQFADPFKVKVTSTQSTMGTSTTTESYITKDGDKYVAYISALGQWGKMTYDNLDEVMAAAGTNSITDSFSDDVSKYTKKDDVEEDGKSYLVYDYTISGDEIKDVIGAASSVGSLLGGGEDSAQMEEIINKAIQEIGDMTITIMIDRDTATIYKADYSMTDMMNKMLNAIMGSLGAEELGSMEMTVADMNASIKYENIGSAADFEIPQEALSAEEISSDLGDLDLGDEDLSGLDDADLSGLDDADLSDTETE